MSRCKTPVEVLDGLDNDVSINCGYGPVPCHHKSLALVVHDARLARELERQASMDTECIERIRNKCYELEAQAEKDKADIARLTTQTEMLWENCVVIYWPHPKGLAYPIEHNAAANKDLRSLIEARLAEEKSKGEHQ